MSKHREGKPMYADDATLEHPALNIPEELLGEATRRAKERANDFGVDGWKPSLFERLTRLFGLG
jgi:hypothetical protein